MIRFFQSPKKAMKYFIGVFLFLISFALVVTLIPGAIDLGGAGSPGVLAKVGDLEVTLREVQEEARRMAQQQFARNIPAQVMPFFLQRATDQLILRKAALEEARRLGLQVSNEELRAELQAGGFGVQLFPGGKYVGREGYESFVQQNFQMGVPQFEQMLKGELLIRKLRALVEGGVNVSPAEVEAEFFRSRTQVKFDYALFTTEHIAQQIHPADAELRAYFEQNKARYADAVPEKRKARYAVVDAVRIRDQVQVTLAELQRYYDERREQFRQPETVDVRHILVKTPAPEPDGKVDEKAVAAARTRAEDLLKQLRAGASFEALAKKHSDDPGSAPDGGLYQGVTRGRMVPEFEKGAFTLEPGVLSEPIQTTFGYHILRVEQRHAARVQPLEEVRDLLEPQVAAEKAAREADNLARNLEREATKQGLAAAAAKHGLDVVNTDFFSRTDQLPGIGFAPQFMEAVFRAGDKAPPALEQIQAGFVVYEVTGIQPSVPPGYEQVRARVESDFRSERAAAQLAKKTAELSDRARAQHDLRQAAKELGAELHTSEMVSPTSQVPDIGQMSGPASVAFAMKPGEISGPINTGRSGVVLAILEKQEAQASEMASEKEQIREQLLARKRSNLMEVFVSGLVERMEKEGRIRKNKEELERLASPLGRSGI